METLFSIPFLSSFLGGLHDIFEIRNKTSFYAGKNAVILYGQLGKQAEAQELLKQIIENYQNEEQIDHAYFLLANNYKDQKDLARALALYEEILFRFPTSLYTELSRKYAREIDAQIKENLN